MDTSLQGIIGAVAPVYCGMIFVFQLFRSHTFEASKQIITLSNLNILLMICATTCASLMYYSPRLWGDNCHCDTLWALALVVYILSFYLLKAIYVTKMHILNQADGPSFGIRTTRSVIAVKVIAISLILSSITCITLCIFFTDGTCPKDPSAYGCIPQFNLSIIYLALAMIVVDGVLFAMFCYAFFRIISILTTSDENQRIPHEIMRAFVVQFILTIIAMGSCAFDAVFQLIIYDPNGKYADVCLVVFSIDCVVVATCNFFTIPETRRLIASAFNFNCDCTSNIINANTSSVNAKVNTERKNAHSPNADTFHDNVGGIQSSNINTNDTIASSEHSPPELVMVEGPPIIR